MQEAVMQEAVMQEAVMQETVMQETVMQETAIRDTGAISGYHAHVYYDADSKPRAARLREAVEARFAVTLGRWHDRPVGPHPRWSYQLAFAPEVFASLVPWLALNRDGLVLFIHPLTGDELADHDEHAIWLGDKLELDLKALT